VPLNADGGINGDGGMISAAAVHAETKLLLTVKKKYYIN
jgi:hypothetical protein